MTKIFVRIALVAVSITSIAYAGSKVYVRGLVRDATSKTVQIETKEGMVRVPRSAVMEKKSIRIGDKVTAHVSLAEIVEKN